MTDLAHYRRRLETRRDELTGRLRALEHELDEPVAADWDEQAQEREDDEVQESLGNQGLAELRAIEAALARIAEGSFGACVNCGAEIAPERLAAVPWAPRCRACAG